MRFLIIGLTSVFLFSCGKSGELSYTKKELTQEAKTVKLSKRATNNNIDYQNTETQKTSAEFGSKIIRSRLK